MIRAEICGYPAFPTKFRNEAAQMELDTRRATEDLASVLDGTSRSPMKLQKRS